MKSRLLRWLVCPQCQGGLARLVAQSERDTLSTNDYEILERTAPIVDCDEVEIEITNGALSCKHCGVYYPILNGIPRMLTYPSEVAEIHAKLNSVWLEENV